MTVKEVINRLNSPILTTINLLNSKQKIKTNVGKELRITLQMPKTLKLRRNNKERIWGDRCPLIWNEASKT
jgi:hypothetical protein